MIVIFDKIYMFSNSSIDQSCSFAWNIDTRRYFDQLFDRLHSVNSAQQAFVIHPHEVLQEHC